MRLRSQPMSEGFYFNRRTLGRDRISLQLLSRRAACRFRLPSWRLFVKRCVQRPQQRANSFRSSDDTQIFCKQTLLQCSEYKCRNQTQVSLFDCSLSTTNLSVVMYRCNGNILAARVEPQIIWHAPTQAHLLAMEWVAITDTLSVWL